MTEFCSLFDRRSPRHANCGSPVVVASRKQPQDARCLPEASTAAEWDLNMNALGTRRNDVDALIFSEQSNRHMSRNPQSFMVSTSLLPRTTGQRRPVQPPQALAAAAPSRLSLQMGELESM